MKKLLHTIAIASVTAMLMSCGSYSPEKELSSIADDLEQNSESYTTEDWENVISEYESVIESLEDYDLTNEEREEIGRQQGRCLAYLTKGYAKIAAEQGAAYMHQLKGVLGGFEEAFGDGSDVEKDIKDAFEGLVPEDEGSDE